MSVATLRCAAKLMRERAEATHLTTDDGAIAPWHTAADLLGMFEEDGDAEHIASWHPLVAIAVSDWLLGAAVNAELTNEVDNQALAVAREYLGDA